MVSVRHETRPGCLCWAAGQGQWLWKGSDSIGDGYAEDLQLQTLKTPLSPRPDYCLWRDVYEVHAHALYLYSSYSDGWLDRDWD
jgi:hypothetical protein